MIDLHCHLLPGVDDGSRSVERSVLVLGRMAAAGIRAVCLTPHLLASRTERGIPPSHDEAFAALSAAAPPPIALYRGVELMLDRPFPPTAAGNRRLTLGGTRYLLVEFPLFVAGEPGRAALAQLVGLGLVPVVAHPERYACATPAVVGAWKETGALMQLDATTLLLPRTRGNRARVLLAEGMADILAADNHGDGRLLSAAQGALIEQGGDRQADLLVSANPRAILEDRSTAPVDPLVLPETLLQRLRRLFQPED